MQNKIALTDDLGQLFLALSLKERILGFNIYGKEVVPKENVGDFLLWKLKKHPTNSDLFSMLTQILILYDGIELPFYSHCLDIIGDVASFTHLTEDVYVVISVDGDTSLINGIESFSIEQAIILKPLIINRCMTKLYDNREVKNFDENRARLINSFYSYIFDCYYNEAHLKSVPDVDEFFENNTFLFDVSPYLEDFQKDVEHNLDVATFQIGKAFGELLTLQKIAKGGPCDFYTPSLSDFHTTTNVSDAYCILKNQISMIMEEQPAFESLTDIIKFREKKYHDIKLLRNEVSNLESLLIQGEKELAIQKAIEDVRSANTSLIKGSPVKQTARLATYFSVPISLLELYTFGTSYSILIGVVGTTAQWIADQSDSKNNWLFVAR